MNRTRASLLVAVVAASLWLLWNFEHQHTSIRAPWTGLTLAASAAGFVAVGVVGRGWRALLSAMAAAAAAMVLVNPLVWHAEWSRPDESCDPGCIPLEVAVVLVIIVAGALATLGILLRRAVGLVIASRAAAIAS